MAESNGTLRALVFMGLAVITGALALVALFWLITTYQQRIEEAKKPEDKVMVIVASRDLYQGVQITENDLYAVEIPPRFLPEGVFLSPEHVVNRYPRERILANEFIRASRLSDPEAGIGLNAVIPRSHRAISIEVSNGAALSGFLNPGNYVDVLVTIQVDEQPETHTLMQQVFVLGVNSRSQQAQDEAQGKGRTAKKKPSVTLLVTAENAERLAHAEAQGKLRLTLRNDLDEDIANITGADLDELLGKLKIEPVRRRAPKPVKEEPTVTIIKGSKREEKKVQEE